MLRDEMLRYEQITGESAEHIPIMKLGAFLDGYDMAIKAVEPKTDILDKIRAEIEGIIWEETVIDNSGGEYECTVLRVDPDDVLEIIDKYRKGLEREEE